LLSKGENIIICLSRSCTLCFPEHCFTGGFHSGH
jgi:hypothetical protein